MTFKEFKKKNRYTHADLAEMFGVSLRTVAYWLKDENMKVTGRPGSRVVRKRTDTIYATEQPLEAV